MTEKKRSPRDIWKEPPRGSEGDAAKEFPHREDEPPTDAEDERVPAVESEVSEAENEASEEPKEGEAGYSPRHRAPGRAPLIRRKRSRIGEEEEVSWETSWSNEAAPRWTTEEEPSVNPPPKPIEELPYLGPKRSEQRRRRPRPSDEAASDSARRSRDYTGRHLAPKKPARWTRADEETPERELATSDDYVEFQDRDRVGEIAVDEPVAGEAEALVEGDAAGPEPEEPRAPGVRVAEPVQEAPSDEVRTEPGTEQPDELPPHATGPAPTEHEPSPDPGSAPKAEPRAPEPPPAMGPAAAAPPVAKEEAEGSEPAAPATVEEPAEPAASASPAETVSLAPAAPTPVPPQAAPPAPEKSGQAQPAEAKEDDDVAADSEEPPGEEDDGVLVDEDGEPLGDEDEDEDAPAGPRSAALLERKKKQRVRKTVGTVAAVLAAAVAIAATGVLVKNVVDPEEKVAVPVGPPAPAADLGGTTLLFGTKEGSDRGRGAIWMTLISYDPESEEASVVYIPPHTAVEVPGRGLQGVGEAYGSGGVPLLLVSAENLLGIKIDRYLELSDKDALVLFEQLEPLTVDVPAEVRVPVGKDEARLIFVEGPQELTPPLLVKLLYIVGIDGDDVELGGRHLAFWQQLLEVHDPEEVATAVERAGAALGESDASSKELAEFLSAVAGLPSEDVRLSALPVRPISAGDSELYATDGEELAAFVEEAIGIDPDAPAEVRVQLLNGNGVPGLGREVADLLVGEGFRVILGGNAQRLNYRRTLVISYDSSEEAIATAERARDLLGVGEVQVSAQQQGIVDLTIVVGKDFLRAH